MNKKTRQLYDAVLDKILTVYDDLYPDVYLNVETLGLMSDFENAIQSSCEQAFVGCTCIGFSGNLEESPEIWPYGCIPEYTYCLSYRQENDCYGPPTSRCNISRLPGKREDLRRESVEIQAAIKRLMDYYYGYWIDTITPE